MFKDEREITDELALHTEAYAEAGNQYIAMLRDPETSLEELWAKYNVIAGIDASCEFWKQELVKLKNRNFWKKILDNLF